MSQHVRRRLPTTASGRLPASMWAPPALASLLLISACSVTGSDGAATPVPTTDPAAPSVLDTGGAAGTAQNAIDQGDELGDCPFGTPRELVAMADGLAPLAEDLADDIDDGQVFFGGDVDIVYCSLVASEAGDDEISEFRIDIAPGADVDLDTYLAEEYIDPEDLEIDDADDLAAAPLRTACWDRTCGVFWQGDDLFVGVTAHGSDSIALEDLEPAARAVIPEVVDALTG